MFSGTFQKKNYNLGLLLNLRGGGVRNRREYECRTANPCWPILTYSNLSWPVLYWPPHLPPDNDFVKNWDLMTMDRNWGKNEIKTILRSSYHLLPLQKQYQNPILLLHWDYFNHISAIYVQNFAYISPIYDPFIILIKAICQSFEFEKKLKMSSPPPTLISK